MVVYPNAKINIGIRIIEKRTDGFHNIETLFVPIGLSDILEVIPLSSGRPSIDINGIELDSTPKNNLVMKAWDLMHLSYNVPPVAVSLNKIIPVGAGLGGGSSDAAFMLKALNDLFACNCSVEELESMASRIGSDCAFFIRNQTALGTGRGEVLTPKEVVLSDLEILLVNPGIHIGSKEAYSGVVPQKQDNNFMSLIEKPVQSWQRNICNDFEKSVFKLYPSISELKTKLMEMGAMYASMTGSGSSVYGLFTKGILDKRDIDFGAWFVYRGELL